MGLLRETFHLQVEALRNEMEGMHGKRKKELSDWEAEKQRLNANHSAAHAAVSETPHIPPSTILSAPAPFPPPSFAWLSPSTLCLDRLAISVPPSHPSATAGQIRSRLFGPGRCKDVG